MQKPSARQLNLGWKAMLPKAFKYEERGHRCKCVDETEPQDVRASRCFFPPVSPTWRRCWSPIVHLGRNNQRSLSASGGVERPMPTTFRIKPSAPGLHNDLFPEETAAFLSHSHPSGASADAVGVERLK